jgi:diaminopimelate epimerase
MSTLLPQNQSPQIKDHKPKTQTPFVKMHGAGNDFVVLDALSTPLPDAFDFARAAQVLCARHFGIGGDGLLLLEASHSADVRMRMWNPDGTEDMCGNGLRCIARLAWRRGHIASRPFVVETLAGLRRCEVLANEQIRIEMGEPLFAPEEIPFAPHISLEATEYALPVGEQLIPHVTSLSTGSTHTVIFVDELPDDAGFFALSPLIENHAWFPERTSVLWTKMEKDTARIRIWERGAGETLACGTGACAVAVAAQVTKRAHSPLAVRSRGGVLDIQWQAGSSIWMTGPARVVFEGAFAARDLR